MRSHHPLVVVSSLLQAPFMRGSDGKEERGAGEVRTDKSCAVKPTVSGGAFQNKAKFDEVTPEVVSK